jgi:ATP-dependent Clp protease ATP-binding subunit ClpA
MGLPATPPQNDTGATYRTGSLSLFHSPPLYKSNMFDRFTDRAKKVMNLARQESQRLNHGYLGTEHVLLGLVQEGSGVAANVLKNMGIDLTKIRMEVEKIVKTGPSMVTMGQLPFTPRGKKVLELSMEEAGNLGHNYIGTEHLLLGLIKENEGIAAQVLLNLGIKLQDVRDEVLKFLGAETGEDDDDEISVDEPTGGGAGRWRSRIPDNTGPKSELKDYLKVFDRFTDRAKKVMNLARQKAQRFNHEYLGTEHVLLGLVQEGSGVAANVLKNMGNDLTKIRMEVEKIMKTGPSMVTMGQLPFTPRTKKVLELSMEEAGNLDHNDIGTEHLLLGLIKENEGIAAQVLLNLGIKLQDVRDEVLKFLGAETGEDDDDEISVDEPRDLGGRAHRRWRWQVAIQDPRQHRTQERAKRLPSDP